MDAVGGGSEALLRHRLTSPSGSVAVLLGLAAVGGTVWLQAGGPSGGDFQVLALLLGLTLGLAVILRSMGRAPDAVGFALALFVAAIAGSLCSDLPEFPSAISEGDSPLGVPIVAGFSLLAIGFFLINPAALSAGELVVLALVMFAAGNGKVWTRSNEEFFPLYAGLAALALAVVPRRATGLVSARRTRWLFGLTVAFLAWILVCGWMGEDPGRTDELFARILTGVVAGWAAARVLDRSGVERALLMAALCGAAVLLVLPALLGAAEVLELAQVLRGTRLRLFSLHPNLTGTFLAVELVLVGGLITKARGLNRLSLVTIGLATLPALYLTRSRTAWMAALLGLAVVVLARRFSRRVWMGVISTAALLILIVLLVAPVREAVLRPSSSSQSLSQRIYLWDASAKLVAESPVFGIGLNNYFAHGRTAATPSYYDNTDKGLHPHNLLLAVAEGSGLIGLALFLGLVGLVVFACMRGTDSGAAPVERGPPLRGVLLAVLATLFAANMFDLGLSQMTFVPTLFWLIAGMAVALESGPSDSHSGSAAPSWRVGLAVVFALLFAARPFLGERYFQAGVQLQEMQDPSSALAAWEQSRRFMPWATAPVIRSAQVTARAERSADAEAFYETATQLSPTHPRYRYRYALFLARENKPARAIEQISRALELDPHSDEEGLFRLLYAECLARTARAAEAREQLKRVVLVAPDDFGRLGSMGWQLPVKDGETILVRDLAVELGEELVSEAASLEIWDVRRRGNHLGKILSQLGETEKALEILEGVQAALGGLDISLERLATGFRAELGRDFESDEVYQTKDKVGRLLDIEFTPEEAIGQAEQGLRMVVDIYFERGIYHQLYQVLFDAAIEVRDDERLERAIEGLLFFADPNSRVEHLVAYSDLLAKRKRGEEALATIADGLVACDAVKHASSREQAAFMFATTALSIANRRGRSVEQRLEFIEDALGPPSRGVTSQLFWIVVNLSLAGEDPSRQEAAGLAFQELRRRHPAEGASIEVYFERAQPQSRTPNDYKDMND